MNAMALRTFDPHAMPDPESLAALRPGAGVDEERDLAPYVAQLAASGWLAACLPEQAGGLGLATSTQPAAIQATADTLRAIGRADLALARLYEGHLNAVKLVELHAHGALLDSVRQRVQRGALLGVWGATADDPLRIVSIDENRMTLGGAKVFTSGLGLVTMAVTPVADAELAGASRLLLIDVDDPERQDHGEWRASGMRATRSGRYRFDDMVLPVDRLLGKPGVYEREPWFEGGIWRYVATHVGGMEALVDELVAVLRARQREGDPHQSARIGEAAALVVGARALVERAALQVETAELDDADAVSRAVTLALLARESVEQAASSLLTIVERALGMGAYERGQRIEQLRRDLGLYLRQAAPDAKLAVAAASVCRAERGIGNWW